MDTLDKQLQDARIEYENKVTEIARQQFLQYIKPYCDQHGCSFTTGMGDWSFSGRGDEAVPIRLCQILDTPIEGYLSNNLASLMPDYDPFHP